MTLDIDKFSPAKAELQSLAEKAKLITTESSHEEIHQMRMTLVKTRTSITKTGKALRDDANAFNKAVLAKEKELLAIVEPEEMRLEALEETAKQAAEREKRKELLPHRKERLAAIGDGIDVADEVLLDMDGPEFEEYVNQRQADKNESERATLAAREAKLRVEEEKQRREQETREREERARQEERERIEREQKEAAERERREQEERETKERQEKERLERETRYQEFLAKHGYSEATKDKFHIERIGDEVKLYTLVGTFKIK